MKEFETIICEQPQPHVALLTLNRPSAGNGVVPELARDFMSALNMLDEDHSVHVLVVTGAGKQFCAGADLFAFQQYIENDLATEQEAFNARILFPLTQRLANFRTPVIAAINGGATAGGLDLALACDMRIASTRAKLGETYIKLGLNPGNGGTYFLPRLVGSGMAAEMAFTGDIVNAEKALEIGLVNRIVDHEALLPTALELASKVAQHSRLALEATKHQLRQSWHMDLSTSLNFSFWAASTMTHTRELQQNVADMAAKLASAKKTSGQDPEA